MTMKARTFNKEQIDDMRTIVLGKIKFSDIVREVTKVEETGNWFAVQCPFHQTSTTDAGRLKDGNPAHGEEGVYWCNNPNCIVAEEPYNGRLSLTHFWKLFHDFRVEPEAVLDLYHGRLGLKLPEGKGTPLSAEEKRKIEEERRMKALFLHMTYFYHKSLLDENVGKEGLNYIVNQRKIPAEYVRRYRLGYAPGGTALKEYLTKAGFTDAEMKKAKILSRRENDLYYKRVMFPLLDTRNNPLDPNFDMKRATVHNMYSRFLPDYIHEKNSFLKHRYTNNNFPLFNFAQARRKRYALMIEGCFDTVASQVFIDRLIEMKKKGELPNDLTIDPEELGAFASYGTNGFNEKEHVPLLKRSKFDVIYLAGDQDDNFAGQEANIKRGKMLQEKLPDTQIRIVTWDNGGDANDLLINNANPVEFLNYLEDSVSLEEYEILVALQKSGSSDIVRNQFEAIHRIEDLLLGLNLHKEDSLIRYKKTLVTISEFINVDVETILLHIMMLKYKNNLEMTAKEANLPLSTLIMAELATITDVFSK